MNSVLGILVALIMAFSSIGGTPVQTEGPVSFDAKISLDAQSVLNMAGAGASVPEETEKTIAAVSDILNALTMKGVADKDAGEIDLYAGNDLLFSLGARSTEEGIKIASSLFGNQVLFLSAEILQASQQQMQASAQGMDIQALTDTVQKLDEEQIRKDFEEVAEKVAKALEEKKGETENGTYTVDDMTFTAKTPVNMTYTEFMTLGLNGMKELLEKESLKPLIQVLSNDTDLSASIDESIKHLNEQPEEEKPEAQIAIYTDENANTYSVLDFSRTTNNESVHIAFGSVDKLTKVRIAFTQTKESADIIIIGAEDGSVNVLAKVDDGKDTADITYNKDAAGKAEMICKINSAGTEATIVARTEPAGNERTQYSMDVFFGNTEKALLTITGTAGKGGETVSVYDGEGITAIPVEKLSDSKDTTATTQLYMSLMTNAMKAVSTLVKNLPDESATWVNSQLTQMMNPQTKTP